MFTLPTFSPCAAMRACWGAYCATSLKREHDALILTVCDRGPGVSADELERIFEPFYRPAGTPETAGGVGLGLSLVRKIVQQHDGQIVCRLREGGGSCFEARLPVAY
jgi:signal transduction histidine kinase